MYRTALALAAAGAVAATAITTAVLTGEEDPSRTALAPSDSSPTPAPAPARDAFTPVPDHAWRPSIPDGLDLSTGLPEPDGDFTRDTTPVSSTFCGAAAFPIAETTDTRRDGTVGPEFGDRRDLRVFPDDSSAHRFLRRAENIGAACPDELHGGTRWIHTVSSGRSGEESVRIVQTYETDGLTNPGATWWNLVRVGNAVLLTASGGEYLPGENLEQGIRDHQALVAPIVGSMCVFAAEGCPDAGPVIPADLPLGAGWPDDSDAEPGRRYGLKGPDDSLPPLEFNYCRGGYTASGGSDVLRADWTNVEDYRGRALLAFADELAAAAFLADFADSWTACPRYSSGGGFTSIHETRPTDLGDESTALISRAEFDGSPAIGIQVVHVVRVGATVLIDTAANEGTGTPDGSGSIPNQVAEQGDALVAVLDSMYHL